MPADLNLANASLPHVRALAASDLNIKRYMLRQPISELKELLSEIQLGIDEIESHLNPHELRALLIKEPLPNKQKRNIKITKSEVINDALRTFLWSGMTLLGAIMVIGKEVVLSALIGGGITAALSIIVASVEYYSLKKNNKKFINRKKLINVEVELLKRINQEEMLLLFDKLAEKSNIASRRTIRIHNGDFYTSKSNWWEKTTPNEMLGKLISTINKHNKCYRRDSHIQKNFDELRHLIKESNIEVVFDNGPQKNLSRWLQHEELTFSNWWGSQRGVIVKETFVQEGVPKSLGLFTVGGLSLTVLKAAGVISLASILTGPVGIIVLASTALLLATGIAVSSVYQKYKNAQREYEIKIQKNAIKMENTTYAKLANDVKNKIKEITTAMKRYKKEGDVLSDSSSDSDASPQTYRNRHDSGVNKPQYETNTTVNKGDHLSSKTIPQQSINNRANRNLNSYNPGKVQKDIGIFRRRRMGNNRRVIFYNSHYSDSNNTNNQGKNNNYKLSM